MWLSLKIQTLEPLPKHTAAAAATNLFCISLAFEDVNWLIIAIHIQESKLIKEGRCRISRRGRDCLVRPGSVLELLGHLGSRGQRDREHGPTHNCPQNMGFSKSVRLLYDLALGKVQISKLGFLHPPTPPLTLITATSFYLNRFGEKKEVSVNNTFPRTMHF